MKILILVLSSVNDIQIEPIKQTWASYKLPEIDIFFYYGKNDLKNTDRDIYLDVMEKYENMGYKTLKMFEYIKDFEYDYVFRTNTSSYVNQEKLLEFLSDKPRDNFYCGIKGYCGIYFCSGCGYFLSKNLVNMILENKNNWNHDLVDDVALGKLFLNLNIHPTDIAKITIHQCPVYGDAVIGIHDTTILFHIKLGLVRGNHEVCTGPGDRNTVAVNCDTIQGQSNGLCAYCGSHRYLQFQFY